jgi:hypothetical protein
MTTVCWTIIHSAIAPGARLATRLAGVARHFIRPSVGRAGHLLRHKWAIMARSQNWVELVCRTIPVAVVGGGLLAPHAANPPMHALQLPPAVIDPGPSFSPWSPPIWIGTPGIPEQSFGGSPFAIGPAPSPEAGPEPILISGSVAAPEPSTAGLLLGGAATLWLIRVAVRRSVPLSGGPEPSLDPLRRPGRGRVPHGRAPAAQSPGPPTNDEWHGCRRPRLRMAWTGPGRGGQSSGRHAGR